MLVMDDYEEERDCPACDGTGLQTFHGLFDSFKATCNFCGGHGTNDESDKWFDESFKERGLM
jgi:DnaJ-class molecular chaperone